MPWMIWQRGGIPECNKEGVTLLEEYGFSLIGSSLRIIRGTKNGGIPEKYLQLEDLKRANLKSLSWMI